MTAAALRPDLFNHLIATQRPHREKSDVAATALSVLLHGTVALALVWASTSIKPKGDRVVEVVYPIALPSSVVTPRTSSGGGGGGSGGGRSLMMPQRFDAPILDVPDPLSVNRADDFAKPGDPSALTRNAPTGPGGGGNAPTRSGFEVRSVAPALLNPDDVKRALERNYPALLRDAGISGRVTLWLLLDESGRVTQTEVKESSGHVAFDDAARKVGELMRFSPAMNRDERIKVWVMLPIVFTTK
jgi:TonB family protein